MDHVMVHFGPRHLLVIGEGAEARARDWIKEQKEKYGNEDAYYEPYRGNVVDFRHERGGSGAEQ